MESSIRSAPKYVVDFVALYNDYYKENGSYTEEWNNVNSDKKFTDYYVHWLFEHFEHIVATQDEEWMDENPVEFLTRIMHINEIDNKMWLDELIEYTILRNVEDEDIKQLLMDAVKYNEIKTGIWIIMEEITKAMQT